MLLVTDYTYAQARQLHTHLQLHTYTLPSAARMLLLACNTHTSGLQLRICELASCTRGPPAHMSPAARHLQQDPIVLVAVSFRRADLYAKSLTWELMTSL